MNDWPKRSNITLAYWYRPSRWSSMVSRLDELFVPADAIAVFSKGERAFTRKGDLDVPLYRPRTRKEVIVHHGARPDGSEQRSSLFDGKKWK